MNFEEWAAKPLIARHGIAVPPSQLVTTADEAAAAARAIGPCVVKAQVPTGKRGKAGGIQLAADEAAARTHAAAIIGMSIAGFPVKSLLVEGQVPIARELYAAVLGDPASSGPKVLFSRLGGMDVEEAAAEDATAMRSHAVDIQAGLTKDEATSIVAGSGLEVNAEVLDRIADTLVSLYKAYRALDAELIEINPLVVTEGGDVVALDCKLTVDDASAHRQEEIVGNASPEPMTDLEAEAAAAGLKYIALDGSVGVLANGAGLTMTTMDAISHYGGSPCNFLEIGGEAYTKAETALTILLKNPNIKALLVNFCGAFARTDVMAGGVVEAWKKLQPDIPVFFSIHGTGEEEAIALVEQELGFKPYDLMDDAVRAAVAAAEGAQ